MLLLDGTAARLARKRPSKVFFLLLAPWIGHTAPRAVGAAPYGGGIFSLIGTGACDYFRFVLFVSALNCAAIVLSSEDCQWNSPRITVSGTPGFLQYSTGQLSSSQRQSIEGYIGSVGIDGLEALSEDEARLLSTVRGHVRLSLKSLSGPAAKQLAKHRGDLAIGRLETLSDEAALELKGHRGQLTLLDTREVSASAIRSLMRGGTHRLTIGLTNLSDSTARAIATGDGYLALPNLDRLSESAAETLVGFRGELSLMLSEISPGVAKALADMEGKANVYLLPCPPRTTVPITGETARELARIQGTLTLDSVSFPHPVEGTVAALARRGGNLDFSVRAPVDTNVVAALGPRRGPLSLKVSDDVTPEAISRLCEMNGDLEIILPAKVETDVAKALASHRIGQLTVSGLKVLGLPVAEAFATRAGPLAIKYFGGWPEAHVDAIVALCRHVGPLHIPSSYIRPDTIDSVIAHKGGLCVVCVDQMHSGRSEWIPAPEFSRLAQYDGGLLLDGPLTTQMASMLAERDGHLVLCDLPQLEPILKPLLRRQGTVAFFRSSRVETVAAATLFISDRNLTSTCSSFSLIGPASSEIATILVRRKGEVSLPFLRYITEDALRILAAKSDVRLPPLDSLYIVNDDGRDMPPADVVSNEFMKENAESQPPPQLPQWHSWDKLVEESPKVMTCPP